MTDTATPVVSAVDAEGLKLFGEHYSDPIIKLATDVYVGALQKFYGEHSLPVGNTEVTISATQAIPEDTPKDFTTTNLLEEILTANPAGFTVKLDFPIEYSRKDLWTGLGKQTLALPARYGTYDFRVTGSETKDRQGLRIELLSKKLNRAVYFDISTPG